MRFSEIQEKYQRVPVTAIEGEVAEQPLVSVCVPTFRHKDFIGQCLDSIIAQEVSFPMEIIVGEDESDDGTREICVAYAQRYPNLIRLFLNSRENNIAINGRSTGRFNLLQCIHQARGKYIAFCDGDDYWIDPRKLQKQVDFLEAHPDVGLVSCEVVRSDQVKRERIKSAQTYVYQDLFRKGFKNFTHSTRVMKNHTVFNDLPEWHLQVNSFDTFMLFITLKYIGSMAVMPFQGVCYRVHNEGLFSSMKKDQRARLAAELRQMAIEQGFFESKLEELRYQRQWRTSKWWVHLRNGRVLKALRLLGEHLVLNLRIARLSRTSVDE